MKTNKNDKYTLTRLASGRPLVVSDSEYGYCFVDSVTARRLAARGVARLDQRPFHQFLWAKKREGDKDLKFFKFD
jgi:hypothetical protein